MKAQDLKNSILKLAIEGKLVPQNLDDVPAKELLAQIQKEKEQLIKDKKIKRNSKESLIFRDNGHFYEKIGKKGESVCIDDKIPFEIPESWEWVRLNNIGFLQTGNTPSTRIPEYYGKDIPFIKPADISLNQINYNNMGLSNLGKTKGRLIKKLSVLMVCIGGSRGKCCFNSQDVCCNQQINAITPFLIDYKFLFNVLCSIYFQKLVFKESTGTATPIVNKTTWGSFIIPLPPLEEQKRIVKKIEELLPYIKEYGEAEEKLEELNETFPEKIKASVLQEAVQGKLVPQNLDDVPAKELLAQIQKEKEQLIKDKKIKRNSKESLIFRDNGHFYEKIGEKGESVCIDDKIPFEIPDTWEWCKLKDITKLGENLNIHTQLNKDTMINYVDIKAIDNKNYCIKEDNIKNEKVINLSSRARRVLEKDQIIYSLVRPYLNNIAIITENKDNYIGTTGLIAFKTLIETKYVFYYLLSPIIREYYLRLLKGFNSPSITKTQFLNTYIPVPPLNEQKRIINKIEQLLKICEKILITL